MIIGLASTRVASSIDEGLDKIKQSLSEASAQGAEIVCFPEAYLPGLRGQDFEVVPFDRTQEERVGRLSRSSSTPGARSKAAKPRTSSIRAKTGSTCPDIRGSSSRSTG